MANPGLNLPPPFEAAIEPYERELMRFMIRMTGDRDDAMDLFQEMCLRAYQAYPRLTDFERIRAWLYRIAINLCRNRARDNARRARVIVDSSVNHREPAVDDASAGQDLGVIRDRRAVILHHVEKGLKARLYACVGGVSIDFQNQIRLGSQLGCEHRVRECIDGATEVADNQKKKVGMLFC